MAGIRLSKTTSYKINTGDTNSTNINFMNGTYSSGVREPNLNLNLVLGGESYDSNGRKGMYEGHMNINRQINRDKTSNLRYLGEFVTGDQSSYTKLYWGGIATNYIELIVGSGVNFGYFNSWLSDCDNPSYSMRIGCQYPLYFLQGDYYSNLNDRMIQANFKGYYQAQSQSYANNSPSGYRFNYGNTICEVKLGNDANNRQKTHLFSSFFDASTSLYLCNNSANNTLRVMPNQTITDTNMWSYVNNSTYLHTYGRNVGTNGSNLSKYITFNFNVTNSGNKMPTVGYLGAYTVNNIQLSKEVYTVGYSKTWSVPISYLHNGIPIMAAEKEQKVEWTPVFSSVKCYNLVSSTKVLQTDANEVDIYLSKTPFEDKLVPNGGLDNLIKNGNSDHWTTTNKTCKIKFTMDSDSLIYIKAVPHWNSGTTSYLTDFWDLELDLENKNGQWTLETDE